VSFRHRQLAPAAVANRAQAAPAGAICAALSRLALALVIATAVGCDFSEPSLSDADRQLIKDNILAKVPTMDLPVNADVGGKLLYLGCDINKTQVSPGESFTVVHYWEVVDPPGPDWKLFTHLGPRTINVDRTPIKGKYPVADWKAGEIIRDEQFVTVPARWTAPFMIIFVGLYHGTTRMEVRSGDQDGDNRVIAVRMPVRGTPREVAVPSMDVRKAWRRPIIDGKLDDPAWAEIATAKPMVNAETGGSVVPGTEIKVMWDARYVYVGLRAADVTRTEGDGISVVLAHDGARQAIEVDVSGLGQVQVWQPSVGTDAPGTNEAPAKSSAARRGKGRNRPGRKFRVGGHSGLQVEAALADVEIRPVNSTLPTSPIATKSGATTTAGSAHAGVTVAAGINAQWTAEVAVPWSAFPGSGAGSVEGVSQLRGNFSRHNQSAEGTATRSAWSPTLGAPLADMAHLGVLNLLDDVGTQLVSRTPPLTPGQRDLPGEMRTLTLDR
jgi:hypothetical protein